MVRGGTSEWQILTLEEVQKRRRRLLRRQKGMKGKRCGEGGEARFLTSEKRPRSAQAVRHLLYCKITFKDTDDGSTSPNGSISIPRRLNMT